MNPRDRVLSCLTASAAPGAAAARPPLLLDLTLWHKWHDRRGSLPDGWADLSQAGVAEQLGAVTWIVARPWEMTYSGIEVSVQEHATERSIRYSAPAGALTARWTLGPDGDWWQTEYPVKGSEDLPAASALIAARRYRWDESVAAAALAQAGETGVVALELPMRPYSDLLHTTLGWAEGLMLFGGEHASILAEMLAILEEQAEAVARRLAPLPGHLLFAPDNLDGQYISPRSFRAYLRESYRRTAGITHDAGKPLMVHAGGPVRRLLPLLVESGVDGIEGIAGPPQSDAALAEARASAGPDFTLWGGIPQGLLVPVHPEADFAAAVRQAKQEATGDPRVILGIADRVSVDSDISRLKAVAGLLQG